MKSILLPLISSFFIFPFYSQAQEINQSYIDKKGNTHLCGKFDLSTLENDTTYSSWYLESQEQYIPNFKESEWKKNLKNTEVEIYIGTWCGDSKNWVPKFVELWKELGLKTDQLQFIALYNGDEHYKQGPNGEEKGKNIHRVPTFIFKEDGKEIARIVEHPQNDLETDVAQIALGVPSLPSYKGANYLMKTIDEIGVDSVNRNLKEVVNKVYRLQSRSGELNTLGYVYLRASEIDKALITFYMNTLCYRYNPNVYDSYAEALEAKGNKEAAIDYYQKVLAIDPKSEHALERIERLKNEIKKDQDALK